MHVLSFMVLVSLAYEIILNCIRHKLDAKGFAFFIYVAIMWVLSLSESRRKAYTDFQTGLFNKSRCNEMLEEAGVPDNTTGIFMIDLNFLKQINDKYGHEAGDQYISD